jgi:hypothetical protein
MTPDFTLEKACNLTCFSPDLPPPEGGGSACYSACMQLFKGSRFEVIPVEETPPPPTNSFLQTIGMGLSACILPGAFLLGGASLAARSLVKIRHETTSQAIIKDLALSALGTISSIVIYDFCGNSALVGAVGIKCLLVVKDIWTEKNTQPVAPQAENHRQRRIPRH